MRKRIVSIVVGMVVVIVIGGSFYMLDFSLAPDPNRMDRDSCFRQQFAAYPESKAWLDSLNKAGGLHKDDGPERAGGLHKDDDPERAGGLHKDDGHERGGGLRDTFVVMPTGERHHAFFVDRGAQKTAIIVHGWRDCAIKFLWLARIYEQELGYNVVLPELHACGESEGDVIQMGWKDRLDVLHWMEVFRADTMVVHGVSMGAATTMMVAGEKTPADIKDLRFVEDCGYTSVWDEFAVQLKEMFGLPEFPLMYTTSLLCKLRYGWSFGEASALEQVKKSQHPMLFIHGEKDSFVPTWMVHPLYEAKKGRKAKWLGKDAEHGHSYKENKEEYVRRLRHFANAK